MSDVTPLPQGSTIGILGGGQLGRMLALAAARLGMKTHIFCPDPDSPAFDVTPRKTVAAYDDEDALARFAAAVDVITYEFENVPARTAAFLQNLKPLRHGANALALEEHPVEMRAPAPAATAAPMSKSELFKQRATEAKLRGYEGVACTECYNFTMVRNGTCLKCDTCGSTSGCS